MIRTINILYSFSLNINVEVGEDFSLTMEEVENLQKKLIEQYRPELSIAEKDTSRLAGKSTDEDANWYEEPPIKEKNPTPAEEYQFRLFGGRWATDGVIVLSEQLWGKIEPLKHWIILTEPQVKWVEQQLQGWNRSIPEHPGEFDQRLSPVIGNRLVYGLTEKEPGYLVDRSDVLGMLMPIAKRNNQGE